MANIILKQHIPIFISSTYEDLIPYRNQVKEVIVKLEQIVKGMEYFGSSSKNSLETCLHQVEESKVFISIIAMRYGSVDDKSGFSYSELEYIRAKEKNIPILIYILDENQPIPPKFVDTGSKAEKLKAFKEKVKKLHTVSFFTTPDNLKEQVSRDLITVLNKIDDVNINENSNILKTHEILDKKIIKEFLLRPKKHAGLEGKIRLMVVEPSIMVKSEIIKAIGLTIGDTIGRKVRIIDIERNKFINPITFLHADGECADWLETIKENDIINVKVRLNCCIVKEKMTCPNGEILSDLTDVVYCSMTLLEIDNKKS